jgi:hypothetical protein
MYYCIRVPIPGVVILATLTLAGTACDNEPLPRLEPPKPPEVKKVAAGKNIILEIQGNKRRVLIDSLVCLREGPLEQLLTRKRTKEHEAILVADVDGRDIHKALLATGAEAGKPVQFYPQFRAPSGTVVKVFLQWEAGGQLRTEPAQKWIRNEKTKKELDQNWVFTGSRLVTDPEDPQRPGYYLANDGDLICLSNFESALLDLPIESSSRDVERIFTAHTERIPPRDTRVVVILEPVLSTKSTGKASEKSR